jgi:hypothetical protein
VTGWLENAASEISSLPARFSAVFKLALHGTVSAYWKPLEQLATDFGIP